MEKVRLQVFHDRRLVQARLRPVQLSVFDRCSQVARVRLSCSHDDRFQSSPSPPPRKPIPCDVLPLTFRLPTTTFAPPSRCRTLLTHPTDCGRSDAIWWYKIQPPAGGDGPDAQAGQGPPAEYPLRDALMAIAVQRDSKIASFCQYPFSSDFRNKVTAARKAHIGGVACGPAAVAFLNWKRKQLGKIDEQSVAGRDPMSAIISPNGAALVAREIEQAVMLMNNHYVQGLPEQQPPQGLTEEEAELLAFHDLVSEKGGAPSAEGGDGAAGDLVEGLTTEQIDALLEELDLPRIRELRDGDSTFLELLKMAKNIHETSQPGQQHRIAPIVSKEAVPDLAKLHAGRVERPAGRESAIMPLAPSDGPGAQPEPRAHPMDMRAKVSAPAPRAVHFVCMYTCMHTVYAHECVLLLTRLLCCAFTRIPLPPCTD